MLEFFFYEYLLQFETISNTFEQDHENSRFSTLDIMSIWPLWFKTIMVKHTTLFFYMIDYMLLSLLLDVLSETNETFQNCSQFKPSGLVQFISRYMQNRFEILLSAVYLHYKPTLSAEKHFKTIHYIKSKFYAIKFQINWIALLYWSFFSNTTLHWMFFYFFLRGCLRNFF